MRCVSKTILISCLTGLFVGAGVVAQQSDSLLTPAENQQIEKTVNDQNGTDAKPKEKREIGKETTKYLKESLKEAYLQFLASSDLATWGELKDRFNNVLDVTDRFKQKYAADLGINGVSAPIVQPTLMPDQPVTSSNPIIPAPINPIPVNAVPVAPQVPVVEAAPTTMPMAQ